MYILQLSFAGDEEVAMNDSLQKCSSEVHEALCDNVDTRSALEAIKTLVGKGNAYIENCRSQGKAPNRAVLRQSAAYITRIFDVFGLTGRQEEVGYTTAGQAGANVSAISWSNLVTNKFFSSQTEETVMPYLNVLADFRDQVRQECINAKASGDNPSISVLKICDKLRDDVLPSLGVRLEDKEGEKTVIKLVDAEELAREKRLKSEAAEGLRIEKEKKRMEAEERKKNLEDKKKIKPEEMFKMNEFEGQFAKFDDKGFPTHDKEGEELSKGRAKKLQKLYEAQVKKYAEYVKSFNGQ